MSGNGLLWGRSLPGRGLVDISGSRFRWLCDADGAPHFKGMQLRSMAMKLGEVESEGGSHVGGRTGWYGGY